MIFIPGHVSSSKNSKQWTGRFLVNSKQTAKYIKDSEIGFKSNIAAFKLMLKNKSKPYKIGLHFVRKSRHKYDFHNVVQTVTDLMTKYEYIDDDNTTEILPFPLKVNGAYETYDKDNPGVYIKIL